MRYAGYFGGLLVAAMILLGLLLHSSNRDRGSVRMVEEISMGDVSQYMEDVRFVSSHGPEEGWRLRADSAEIRNEERELRFSHIDVRRYSRQGDPLRILGETGSLDLQSHDLHVEGHSHPVVLTLGNRYRAETASLQWIEEKQEVRSDDPVSLWGPKMHIEGNRFVGRPLDGEYEIGESVRASFQE